ncbi:MAG: gliding motility-associated C-terminal domain-containing protein [Bacteroidetes bacterium]|nr:gliding motility-associated C-terminal domain-containing protein [Bacteroidota bacterium]
MSFCFIFSFSCFSQVSQNLIKNYSSESFSICPDNNGQIDRVLYYYKPNYTSTDYFNSCAPTFTSNPFAFVGVPNNYFGAQNPKTGQGYLGVIVYSPILTSYREYISTQLSKTLQLNKKYCVTFYASLAEISRFSIKNIGFNFTSDSSKTLPPPNQTPLILNPSFENNVNIDDTLNWIKVQNQYSATGVENYITIGNFRDNANTNVISTKILTGNSNIDCSYYYIDDISVVEINPAKAAAKDTLLVCANATYTLGTDSTWDATYQWQPTTGLSCTNCPNPVITATNNATYYLTKQQCSATTKDSVVIKIYNTPVTILPLSNATICVGNTTTLSVDNNNFFNYSWQPAIGLSCTNCALPIASPSVVTTYTLTKSACGFSNTATVSVNIKPNFTLTPQISLTNTVTCLYDTLKFKILNAPVANDINYNWQPQNTFISSFTNTTKATIQNNSYYFVTISNSNNGSYCPFIKKDSIYVSLPDTCIKPLVIPTIFTPNFDNVNDVWKFTMPYGTKLNAVYVYNRWGALIYSIDEIVLNADNSKTKVVRWDGHTTSGEECGDGIYFYIVSVTENSEHKTFKGNVTLIR